MRITRICLLIISLILCLQCFTIALSDGVYTHGQPKENSALITNEVDDEAIIDSVKPVQPNQEHLEYWECVETISVVHCYANIPESTALIDADMQGLVKWLEGDPLYILDGDITSDEEVCFIMEVDPQYSLCLDYPLNENNIVLFRMASIGDRMIGSSRAVCPADTVAHHDDGYQASVRLAADKNPCVDIRVDIPRYYQVVVEKDCVPSDAYDCKIRKPSYDGRFARY